MTLRIEKLPLLMAYAVDKTFKIGQLAMAKFSFDAMGQVAAFELLYEGTDNMRLISLENGETYDWDRNPDSIFLPLKITIKEDFIEWTTADGQSDATETEDGDNQDDFDDIYDALQRNFAYLREKAIRKEPVVIYQHGLPTDAYLDAIDSFLEEPFREEDY